jgi:hypothetical protein
MDGPRRRHRIRSCAADHRPFPAYRSSAVVVTIAKTGSCGTITAAGASACSNGGL